MSKKCSICGKENKTVGPKIIAKTKSKDKRLLSKNDALATKIICQECYDSLKSNSDERIQKCLNPECDNILFISGKLGQDTDMQGIDRDVNFQEDSKGYFIECPKCTAKHNIEMWNGPTGSGGRWKIAGLRH